MRAAYEQGKILARRQKISTLLAQDTLTPEEKRKLNLVLEARTFANEIGLAPGKSYLTYSKVDSDALAWIGRLQSHVLERCHERRPKPFTQPRLRT